MWKYYADPLFFFLSRVTAAVVHVFFFSWRENPVMKSNIYNFLLVVFVPLAGLISFMCFFSFFLKSAIGFKKILILKVKCLLQRELQSSRSLLSQCVWKKKKVC